MTDFSVNKDGGLDDETSLSLLVRLREQDQGAWGRMVSLYSPLIIRWCRQGGLADVDAADVGQEVFLAASRKIRDFHRDRRGDTFRGWLRTITRHKVCDFLRARGADQAVGGELALKRIQQIPTEATVEEDADERTVLYRRAVELIRKDYEEHNWQAFWRVVVTGQPPEDVARDMAMTTNAVYLAKSRILRRLRQEFADLIEPGHNAGPPTPPTDR